MTAQTLRAQVAEQLRDVVRRDYTPGSRIPAEKDLARELGFSRNTVREAVGLLVAEGVLDRKWGVGTTVLDPAARHPPAGHARFGLGDVIPVKDVIYAAGRTPGLRRWLAEQGPAPDDIATALFAGGPPVAVWHIERLFTINDQPAVFVEDWCLTHIAGTALDVHPLHNVDVDLATLIHEQTGTRLARLEGSLQAALATDYFLAADGQAVPVLQIRSTGYSEKHEALVFTRIQFDTRVVDIETNRDFSS